MPGKHRLSDFRARVNPPQQMVYLLRPVFARDPLLGCLTSEGLMPRLLPIIHLQPSSELPFDYSEQERTLWFFPGRLSVYVFWSYFWHLFSQTESLVLCRGTATHSLFAYLLEEWRSSLKTQNTTNPAPNTSTTPARTKIRLLEPCPIASKRSKHGKQSVQTLSMDTLSTHLRQQAVDRVVFVLRNGETFPYLQKYGTLIEQYATIEWVLWEAYSVIPHPGWNQPHELEHWLMQAAEAGAPGLITSILPLRYLQPHLTHLLPALKKLDWYVVGQTTATYAQMIGFPLRTVLPLGTPQEIARALVTHLMR